LSWSMKKSIAALIGRPMANRLAAPYHQWMARRRNERFLRSLPSQGTLVNIGCGYRPLSGWVNLDLVPGYAEIVWDIRNGLPFKDQSVTALFCEHVIEHLTKEDGMRLVREFRRVVQKGGVARISTPDARKYLLSYVNNDDFLRHPRFGDGRRPRLDLVNQMMRENGHHLWVYDQHSLSTLLHEAGFEEVRVLNYGTSTHHLMEGIDSIDREFESLYVEALG